MGLHSGLSLNQNVGVSSIQPELQLYLNLVSISPTSSAINNMNQLITNLKSSGVWQKLDALYLFNQANSGSIGYNLVSPGTYNLTFTGLNSNTFINNVGIQGDGISFYADTGCNLATSPNLKYTSNSCSMFIFTGNNDINEATFTISCANTISGTTVESAIRPHSGGSAYYYPNVPTGSPVGISVTSSVGFSAWTANGTSVTCYKDNSPTISSYTSSNVPNGHLLLFRNSITGTQYSRDILNICGWGGSLTSNQMISLYTSIYSYAVASGIVIVEAPPSSTPILPGYFTANTIAAVTANTNMGSGFRVYQQAAPPTSNTIDNTTYAFFPVSDCSTQQVDSCQSGVTSETTIRNHHWFWQMRSIVSSPYNTKPNILPPGSNSTSHNVVLTTSVPPRNGVQYSTVTKADAATECMIRYSLGYANTVLGSNSLTRGYLDVATAAGFNANDVVTWNYAYNNQSALFSSSGTYAGQVWNTCLDKIILPNSRIYDAPMGRGIVLDSEAQDGRSPSQLLAQLQTLAAICAYRGFEFLVYPNSLNQAGAIWTGYSANNLYQICSTPNVKLCITAYKGNIYNNIDTSISNQLSLLTGPSGNVAINYSNLLITCGMGSGSDSLTTSDASIINGYLKRGMLGAMIWRNFGQPGGALSTSYNQALATILGLPTV